MTVKRATLVSLHFAEYAFHLALALSAKLDVQLVLYRDNAKAELGDEWAFEINRPALECVVLDRPSSVGKAIGNARRLVASIRRFSPDVVHYQEDPRDEILLALPIIRRPSVLTIHDPLLHSGEDSKRLKFSRFRLHRPILRRAVDAVITHGAALVDDLVSASPRLRGRSYVIAHGPLGRRGLPTRPAQPHDLKLLFFGRMHSYKGLRYFVDAIFRLRAMGYHVTGVVAGRGPDLAGQLERMQGTGFFEVLNRYIAVDEIPSLFLNARAVVLPYIDGTQSGVAAMALGYGRPVVASAVGSIPELVKDGVNGLLVPPRDSAALAKAIETVIVDDMRWNRMARAALELRDGELSWNAIAEKTVRVYEHAGKGTRR